MSCAGSKTESVSGNVLATETGTDTVSTTGTETRTYVTEAITTIMTESVIEAGTGTGTVRKTDDGAIAGERHTLALLQAPAGPYEWTVSSRPLHALGKAQIVQRLQKLI